MAKERTCLLLTSPTLLPMDSKIKVFLLEPACGYQVSRSNPGLGLLGTVQLLNWQREGLYFMCNATEGCLSKAWARYTTIVDSDMEPLPLLKGDLLAQSRVLLCNLISVLLRKPTNPFN